MDLIMDEEPSLINNQQSVNVRGAISVGTDEKYYHCVTPGNHYYYATESQFNDYNDVILYTQESRDGEASSDCGYLDVVQSALATVGESIHSLCGEPVDNTMQEGSTGTAFPDSNAARDFHRGSFEDYCFDGYNCLDLELDEI